MSSGSESDDDYVPGEPEQVSEVESADDETELQYEKELEHKAKKRKPIPPTKGTKKRKTRNGTQEPTPEPQEEKEEQLEKLDPVEEKKREDDLWAKFLEGSESKPKATQKAASTSNESVKSVEDKAKPETKSLKQSTDDNKAREKRIFEFAGETIFVENNVIKQKIKTAEAPASAIIQSTSRGRSSGGLSNILGQLNKKDQLSTLEKSKLDWSTYKQEEGLDEEIQSHNKGKSGYLDRQDFLERADLRQYEIERDLRMSRRSNR